jgi:hypothetical protein
MAWFKDNVFKRFFNDFYQRNDSYKDVNGRGLLQRFIETKADDLDTNVLAPLDDFIENTLLPNSIVQNLLPYREGELGVNLFFDNTIAQRRRVLQYFIRISQVKGTKRGYELCFRLMSFQNLIINTVDTITYFDDPHPVAGCNACYDYDVILTGSLLIITPDIVDAFFNIIDYNEPVDCDIRYVIYNGNYVVRDFVVFFFANENPFVFQTANADAHLYLDNSRNPTFSASFVDSTGHLWLSGSDEEFYEFDDKYFGNGGHIFFRKPIPTAYTFFNSLTPTNITKNSFSSNWNAKAGAVKYFLSVGRSRANDNEIIKERVVNNLELGSGVTTYSIASGLLEDTAYYYQIIAENASGQRALSSVQALITLQTVSTPTAISPTATSSYFFIAAWNKLSGATAYEIDIATNNTFTAGLETILVRDINQKMIYRTTGTYYYRVRAKIDRTEKWWFKPVSMSGNSNTITVTI